MEGDGQKVGSEVFRLVEIASQACRNGLQWGELDLLLIFGGFCDRNEEHVDCVQMELRRSL